MSSKSSKGQASSNSVTLLHPKKWQRIQDLFAKIIGANISFLDPWGNDLVRPSRVTGFCPEIAKSLTKHIPATDCASRAAQDSNHTKKTHYCPHHFYYYTLGVRLRRTSTGHLIIGPILVAKREDEKSCRQLCESLGIDTENFLDRLREIKIFSHTGISTVMEFVHEMTESFVRRDSQEDELTRLIPPFMRGSKQTEKFFSTVFANELANSLLDVAAAVVGADSGSVLLIKPNEKYLYIKTARGIRPEIIKRTHIPVGEGVVGWVLSQGSPALIQSDVKDPVLKARLQRSEIKSSIVVPIAFQDQTLGALCVNAESDNKRFNQENLQVLDQLSKLASIALDRINGCH